MIPYCSGLGCRDFDLLRFKGPKQCTRGHLRTSTEQCPNKACSGPRAIWVLASRHAARAVKSHARKSGGLTKMPESARHRAESCLSSYDSTEARAGEQGTDLVSGTRLV